MRPYQILDSSDLLHALAVQTAKYTKMLADGARHTDLANCQESLESIMAEIHLREKGSASTGDSAEP